MAWRWGGGDSLATAWPWFGNGLATTGPCLGDGLAMARRRLRKYINNTKANEHHKKRNNDGK
eukprot:9664211-Lingulodinium_polyedra.AAC.1